MVICIWTVLDPLYTFWANLVQKIEIVCWKSNQAPRLMQICWFRWWRSIFLSWSAKFPFGKIWSKKPKFDTYAYWNMLNSMWIFICPALDWKYFLDDDVHICYGGLKYMLVQKLNLCIFYHDVWDLRNETDIKKNWLKWWTFKKRQMFLLSL